MVEHASVFYIKPNGPYVLFYDSDLEKLKTPKRRWFIKGADKTFGRVSFMRFEPFQLYQRFRDTAMRVIYKPEETEYSRQADSYVDRVIVVDDDLLAKGEMQFALAFPVGLPVSLVQSYSPLEVAH